jgi:hypothetical protein
MKIIDVNGLECIDTETVVKWCKNSQCNAWDIATVGACKHFANGVWAEVCCGC